MTINYVTHGNETVYKYLTENLNERLRINMNSASARYFRYRPETLVYYISIFSTFTHL